VSLAHREQKTPAYLAINPGGTVPAFEDENGVIGDSLAIMRYIDARPSGQRLFPSDDGGMAAALRWIERADTEFWDVSHHLYWQLIEPPPEGTNWKEVRRLKDQGEHLVQELERILSDRPYIFGEFSVVDVVLLPWIYGYKRFDLPECGRYPHVERWRDALSARRTFADNYNQAGIPLAEFLAGSAWQHSSRGREPIDYA
jgi:glutathione S-transferase